MMSFSVQVMAYMRCPECHAETRVLLGCPLSIRVHGRGSCIACYQLAQRLLAALSRLTDDDTEPERGPTVH